MAAKIFSLCVLFSVLVAGAQAANVCKTAEEAGLTTLVAVIKAANFQGTFCNNHLKATIFGPTNDAFAELIDALGTTAEDLLENKPLLRKVLKYHVVGGAPIESSEVPTKFTKVWTWLGKQIGVKRSQSGVTVSYGKGLDNKAEVVTADVKAARSIVHVINKVLVPPMKA